MAENENKACQICSKENRHTRSCEDCGLVFCPCSEIPDAGIIITLGPNCPNCGSSNVVDDKP